MKKLIPKQRDEIQKKVEQLFYGKNNYTAFEMIAIEEEFENFLNANTKEEQDEINISP